MRNAWGVSGGKVVVSAVLSAFVAVLVMAAPALAAVETPVTEAPTEVTGTSATFHGTLNPGASGEAGYYFMYAGGTEESCEGPMTKPGAEKAGEAIKVSTQVTKLEALTKYTYCVVATHLEGETAETAVGSLQTFETPASAPVIEGGEVISGSVTPKSVSLSALINPENQTTTCVIEYGTSSTSENIVPCEIPEFGGAETLGIPASLTNLTPGTVYHYRVVVANETGETVGPEAEFTTVALALPIVQEEKVTKVTSTSAKLEAVVNPNYQETTYAFEYGTDPELNGASVVPGAGPFGEEFAFQPVSTPISGLQPRTVYYYRVSATNGSGTEHGPIEAFETLGAPIVTNGAAEEITRTTAVVSGIVNPSPTATSAHIAYMSQEDYEAAVAEELENPFEGEGGRVTPNINIPEPEYKAFGLGKIELRELKAGTTYDFVVVATNSEGTTIASPPATFTTSPATPPVATTGEAVGVTQTAATLTGTVNTQGLRTTMSFEMGETTRLGLPELASVIPGSESGTTVGIELSFGNYLPPGTTFYYRACATNADGTNCGVVKTFTTASFPMPPAYSVPSLPVLPIQNVTPPGGKTSGGGAGSKGNKKKSGSSKKLAKALKACAKKPKSKRAACRRQARKKYGKKG